MERWISIPDYEEFYSVSDRGRVRIEVRRQNIRKGAMLTQSPQKDGYLYVALRRESETKPRNFAVSRLVLAAFIRPPKKGEEANHKNGDILDNSLDNLEWATRLENVRHSMEVLGNDRKGAKNPAAKLTAVEVVALREAAFQGKPYTSLGQRFGISAVMARNIATGRAWKDAGGPISGPRTRGRPPSKIRPGRR